MGKMRFINFAIIASALFLGVGEAKPDVCPQFSAGTAVGALQSPLINEASGLAVSRKNANVLWTHNDKGGSPRIFAINRDGAHLGIYNLAGASARDYEDIAIGPGPAEGLDYLYIGDIGDNYGQWSEITIYRVAEPVVDSNQLPAVITLVDVDSITLQYPDGARNAETLMVDAPTKDIYIVTKEMPNSRVYRAPYPQSTNSTITMEYKCRLPWGTAVGGDISPAGNLIIVKGYSNASLWKVEEDSELWQAFSGPECSIPLVTEPQGEAIAFNSNGCGYFTVSENHYQPLYYFARDIEPLLANLDCDCDVDIHDYAIFASEYTELPTDSIADLNGNGRIDIGDLFTIANEWLLGVGDL